MEISLPSDVLQEMRRDGGMEPGANAGSARKIRPGLAIRRRVPCVASSASLSIFGTSRAGPDGGGKSLLLG